MLTEKEGDRGNTAEMTRGSKTFGEENHCQNRTIRELSRKSQSSVDNPIELRRTKCSVL